MGKLEKCPNENEHFHFISNETKTSKGTKLSEREGDIYICIWERESERERERERERARNSVKNVQFSHDITLHYPR